MLTSWETWLKKGPPDAVVMGVSAGAVEALERVLPAFEPGTPFPIVIVVHVPKHRPSAMPEVLRPRCKIPVLEANDKEPVAPGTIWLAPADYHLLIERDRCFSLSIDEPVLFSRPSIDVLFHSAVDAYAPRVVAVVLTGASRDGADGARAVSEAGGFVMAEDPATAQFRTMPEACVRTASPGLVADLTGISRALGEASRRRA
jgi:two-component system, chemotaxis family, protein-glutamate methylesterase/glutaminase